MILSSNFPFLVVIFAQYYVKCGHEYDFSFDSIYIPCPFHLYLRMCFSVVCISLIIGIRPQISLFVTRSKGSIPRQREPCIFMVGSNAVVGMLIVALFTYDYGSDLHNRLINFDFSKSWGSFYVKGVLFSFVFFGGLVSYFFDIAYPGVHDCVSLYYYHGETRISWICFIVRTW